MTNIKQKLVITIESTDDDKVNIKHVFTPSIDMKNEGKNNRAILQCFITFMEMLNKQIKKKK